MKHTDYMAEFLRDDVNINRTRLDTLQSNVDAITNHLSGCDAVGDLYLGYSKQGSWAHGTIIKPQRGTGFDADILVHFDSLNDFGAADLIGSVYRGLRESGIYQDKTSRKDRCVCVDYAGEHHVDVVPFIGDINGWGKIANRSEDAWEDTNPAVFRSWFDERNAATDGELKRVMRLLKYLRDIKQTFSVKSVILTVLVADQVSEANDYPDTPTALRGLLSDLANYLDRYPDSPPRLRDPSNPAASLGHRWDKDTYPNLVVKIRYYADKVDAAYNAVDRQESMRLWREVFPAFGTDPAKMARTRTPDGEESLFSRFGIPFGPDSSISCELECRSNGDEIHTLVSLNHHKKYGLDFTLRTNADGDFAVYWKVKNTGAEARNADDLRGEVTKGGMQHHESVKYAGEHWVEVYIVQNGVCVARARRCFKFQRLPR